MYRYVVELMGMVVEFIQNMEEKIRMVQAIPKTDSYLSNLVSVCVCVCLLELKTYRPVVVKCSYKYVLCFETSVYMCLTFILANLSCL